MFLCSCLTSSEKEDRPLRAFARNLKAYNPKKWPSSLLEWRSHLAAQHSNVGNVWNDDKRNEGLATSTRPSGKSAEKTQSPQMRSRDSMCRGVLMFLGTCDNRGISSCDVDDFGFQIISKCTLLTCSLFVLNALYLTLVSPSESSRKPILAFLVTMHRS